MEGSWGTFFRNTEFCVAIFTSGLPPSRELVAKDLGGDGPFAPSIAFGEEFFLWLRWGDPPPPNRLEFLAEVAPKGLAPPIGFPKQERLPTLETMAMQWLELCTLAGEGVADKYASSNGSLRGINGLEPKWLRT